jgi:hypothetical protein
VGLPGTVDKPRPEDYGVTADQVERAPELRITRFRPVIFAVLYVAVIAILFLVIFAASNSLPAAVTFSVILGAAGSIVLIPFLVCLLCASEKAETQWLCRKFPALKACLAYREALVDFKRRTEKPTGDVRDHDWWVKLPAPMLRSQVERALERRGLDVTPAADREAQGWDLAFLDDGGRVLVRCEEGVSPTGVGVGRELTACLNETGARRAILVTPLLPSMALESYLVDRPINVVQPWDILGSPPAEL